MIEATGHDWSEWKTTKEASETEEGEETRTCQKDSSHVETRTIPVLAHIHELQKVDKKDSTCKEEGNIEYYRCSKCEKIYSDREGKDEISLEETVIAKTAHTWDDGVITKEPEADVAGEKTYTCIVCGQTRTEVIEAQTKDENDQEKAESEIEEKKEPVLVSSIKLTGISHNIAAGRKIQLTASISPKNAANKKLKWTSRNTKVAIVSQNGSVTVKAKTGGKTVIIKAEACDGSGRFCTWKIKSMKGAVKSVKISGKKKVKAGKALKLKAKVKATKGANKKLKWTSNNTKYATVNGSGKVTAKAAGKGKSVRITAMATDGSGKKKTVTIKIK